MSAAREPRKYELNCSLDSIGQATCAVTDVLARSSRLSIRAAQIQQKLRFCGWVLSICPFAVKTQVYIGVHGRHYYIDILIEDLHLIIEFDGVAKLGETRVELEQAKREWVLRDENLRDAGWRVIRVSWPDYDDWEQLRIRLSRVLGPINPAPECRFLWKLPTQRCDGPLRRFYSRSRA